MEISLTLGQTLKKVIGLLAVIAWNWTHKDRHLTHTWLNLQLHPIDRKSTYPWTGEVQMCTDVFPMWA